MPEKIINLKQIRQIDLYGINNSKANLIKSLFPELKIVTREENIKIIGEEDKIEIFSSFIEKLIRKIEKYNTLSDNDIISVYKKKIQNTDFDKIENETIVFSNTGKPIKARNENQQKMIKKYNENDLLFALGPAGTGKTYLAVCLAVRALKNKEVKRILISRPAVEAGEKLGFLPGDVKEKLDPYLQALYDALHDLMPVRKLNDYMENGVIQIAPLSFMRGRTLSNSVVILDEAQNTTVKQLKMFLTRMGKNSKFIVTGDITQIDLPNEKNSGLLVANKILKNIKGIGFINFTQDDIVRHRLVAPIVKAFSLI